MKRKLGHVVLACVLILVTAIGTVGAQQQSQQPVDWDHYEAGWVYITISQQTSNGVVEFRDAYRILPDFEREGYGVRIVYYEKDETYTLTLEDAFLLREALLYFKETKSGEQRQMNGRQWKGFTFQESGQVLGQIELYKQVGGTEKHVLLIPVDQMEAVAKAIQAVLLAIDAR